MVSDAPVLGGAREKELLFRDVEHGKVLLTYRSVLGYVEHPTGAFDSTNGCRILGVRLRGRVHVVEIGVPVAAVQAQGFDCRAVERDRAVVLVSRRMPTR